MNAAASDERPVKTVAIDRRWAIGGAIAVALVIAALLTALIIEAGDTPAHPGGPAGIEAPMGAPPFGAQGQQPQGVPGDTQSPQYPSAPESGSGNGGSGE